MKKVIKIEKYISDNTTQISLLIEENGRRECLYLDAYSDETIFAYAIHTQLDDYVYFEKDNEDNVVLFKNITQQFEISDYDEEESQNESSISSSVDNKNKSERFWGITINGWLAIIVVVFVILYFGFLKLIN